MDLQRFFEIKSKLWGIYGKGLQRKAHSEALVFVRWGEDL